MLSVLLTLALGCGCTAALVDGDGGQLVACTADVRRGWWWCECADPECPEVCQHVDALLLGLV
jgi:hypothetical protein